MTNETLTVNAEQLRYTKQGDKVIVLTIGDSFSTFTLRTDGKGNRSEKVRLAEFILDQMKRTSLTDEA